jgi:hypothetical protein
MRDGTGVWLELTIFMTELTKVKAKARVSNWHKLMGALNVVSLLAAIPGPLALLEFLRTNAST